MASGILSGTKVLVGDSDLKSQLKEKGFGEIENKALILSIIEAAYLLDTEKMEVVKGDESLSFEDLVKIGDSKEEEFFNKYLVYKDLRERGLEVRTGLKFGTDFRLYDRGAGVGKGAEGIGRELDLETWRLGPLG